MPDSSIDRSVTLPEVPAMNDRVVYNFLRELRGAIAAAYDNLAERINLFLVLQDWQYSTHPQLTASQNDYNLGDGVVHRFSTGGPQTVTGFLAPQVGSFIIVLNEGPDAITIANESASSSADNRILNASGGDFVLNNDQTAAYWYDNEFKRWRQISL